MEHIPKNLDLFSRLPTNLAVGDHFYVKYPCRNALDGSDVDLIDITVSPDKSHYTDLNGSYLVVEGKYVKREANAKIPAAPNVGPINNLANSLWKSVNIWYNNKKVTPPEQHQNYIDYLYKLLDPKEIQESQHSLALFSLMTIATLTKLIKQIHKLMQTLTLH